MDTASKTPSARHRATILAPDATGIAEAARLLREGRLVAFPTETVYGLGADATNPAAVAQIYAAKGRPHFNPLIAHVPDRAAAYGLGIFSETARKLAEAFWPGPLTLVVEASQDCPVSELARAGLTSVAIRVPDHPVAHALLAAASRPIVAPSANRSGHVSPSLPEHVLADLGNGIDAVIDGGASEIGLESTILGCLDDGQVILLRTGGITRDAVARVIGYAPVDPAETALDTPVSPGRLASHYAPAARLRLDAQDVAADEALLAFGPVTFDTAAARQVLNLSPKGDLAEGAANLYGHLRLLDTGGIATIAVMSIPGEGLAEAIRDRLGRAAAPRP